MSNRDYRNLRSDVIFVAGVSAAVVVCTRIFSANREEVNCVHTDQRQGENLIQTEKVELKITNWNVEMVLILQYVQGCVSVFFSSSLSYVSFWLLFLRRVFSVSYASFHEYPNHRYLLLLLLDHWVLLLACVYAFYVCSYVFFVALD